MIVQPITLSPSVSDHYLLSQFGFRAEKVELNPVKRVKGGYKRGTLLFSIN